MSRIKELRASIDKKLDALEHHALALEAQLTQTQEQAMQRLEADPALLGPVAEAHERLRRAREDPPELLAARAQVAEATTALSTPPEPLA